jgi:hypothetical protein
VAGALVQDVPVEAGAELGPVVGLDDLDPERQPLQHIVQELDGGLLVELGIAAQHAQAGAVVDGGELVVRLGLGGAGQRLDEPDVELDAVAGQGLLIALPAPVMALMPLGRRQPVQLQPLQDPPDAGAADLHLVVALEVHRDPGRPEVVVLAPVDDLADDLGAGGVGAHLGPVGAVPEPVQAVGVVAALPAVEALAADALVAASQRDVAGDLLSMAQDRQAPRRPSGQLLLGPGVSSLVGDPKCQPSPSVPYFQFWYVPPTRGCASRLAAAAGLVLGWQRLKGRPGFVDSVNEEVHRSLQGTAGATSANL